MTTGTTIGLDVGKTAHHACAMLASGEIIYDKPLPQDETALRQVFIDLQAHGTVLMVVDQPNTIGALPIAVARDAGCHVGYLPGLAMRKAADLYPGRSKPTAGTRSSSPTPPAPCHTPCGPSTATTRSCRR